jgi:GT2 family glycosyltransferase
MSTAQSEILSAASVIVATRDRPELLRDLLDSLMNCSPRPGEVIVVDDASSRQVSPIVDSYQPFFRVRCIRNSRRIGPAASRNIAVHASRGDYLLFTDDDCIVCQDWVAALVHGLEKPGGNLGGVGGQVLARDQDVYSRYLEFHRVLEARPHDAQHPDRVPYLVTANCAVHRNAFMRAGGFDEAIEHPGGEDAALAMRMVKVGYHFERVTQAIVRHRFRPGLRALSRMFYLYGYGGRYVVDRYLPLGR